MVTKSPASVLSKLVILVVEAKKDDNAAGTIAAVLARQRAHVISTDSIDRAMEVLTFVSPDLLVSDVDLPGDRPFGLIGQVRALARGGAIRALAIVAREPARTAEAVGATGYQGHLARPFEAGHLLDAVEQVFGQPR